MICDYHPVEPLREKEISDMIRLKTICDTCNGIIEELEEKIFDRYILDLNAAAFGLKESEVLKTKEGLLTGWVLLTNYILVKDSEALTKTVILSDYIGFCVLKFFYDGSQIRDAVLGLTIDTTVLNSGDIERIRVDLEFVLQ